MDEQKSLNTRQALISRLTELRMKKDITQDELARRLGIQQLDICRFESGEQDVSLDFCFRAAAALGGELQYVWVGSESQRDLVLDLKETAASRYSLRLLDEELLLFSLENQEEGLQTEILWAKDGGLNQRPEQLPLDLTYSDEGILEWLQQRVIPKNRAFADEILKSLGLSLHDTKGIIDVCLGLSLNDSYWVVPEGFSGTFAEYNLYENRFSEELALLAFTGTDYSQPVISASPELAASPELITSPELTTHGVLRKAWRYIEDDGVYLYKGGTEGGANTGMEPFSEFYACQIAKAMGLYAVRYDLENWNGILASKCRIFTSPGISFVPAGHLVPSCDIGDCLKYYASLGDEFVDPLRSMLIFDAVIYNEGRTFDNFGLFRDSPSGKIILPAPIFDNGQSLFNYGMQEDFADPDALAAYAATRSNPYGISYEEICQRVCGRDQWTQLRRLIGFKFQRHPNPDLNLPEWRLTAIEEQIRRRVLQLLELVKYVFF